MKIQDSLYNILRHAMYETMAFNESAWRVVVGEGRKWGKCMQHLLQF